MRSPEEGPSTRAGPSTSGGSGHTASDQWRGRPRDPRRGEGDVLDPETASAPTPEPSTAERRIRSNIHRSNPAPPSQNASPGIQPETTRAGLPRQRMKWSVAMNEELIRCYFIATNLESLMLGYRGEMRRLFLTKYPQYSFLSEQRLADQRRAIVVKNLLNEVRRNEIKSLVSRQMSPGSDRAVVEGEDLVEEINIGSIIRDDTESRPDLNMSGMNQSNYIESSDEPLVRKLRDEFMKAGIEFGGIRQDLKPKLPRIKYGRDLIRLVKLMNDQILCHYLPEDCTFVELHARMYDAAVAITRCCGKKLMPRINRTSNNRTDPPWKMRLDRKIEKMRQDLGRLHQWNMGNRSRRLKSKISTLLSENRFHRGNEEINASVTECIDSIRQRMQVLVQRRTRYWVSYMRKNENRLFTSNERAFFRKITDSQKQSSKNLVIEDHLNYWTRLWSVSVDYNNNASWLADYQEFTDNVPLMEMSHVTPDDISRTVHKTSNWNAPGEDGIYNFFYKYLSCTHRHLARHINEFLQQPQTMPAFLMKGLTSLLPKKDGASNPSDFRPITCLPTAYKLITAVFVDRIMKHCEDNRLIPEEQKGCGKHSMGCKEQLIIDGVVNGQAIHSHRNLYAAYIDFRKAFDSIPHSWLLCILRMNKVAPAIVGWLEHSMDRWITRLKINVDGEEEISREIEIRRGIFQGDSLSPLLFCMALGPLSFLLKRTGYGFRIRHNGEPLYKLSHLLYVDDLKLYASTEAHLRQLLSVTTSFAECVRLDFGTEKCRSQAIIKGAQSSVGFELGAGSIEAMERDEAYKYLGFHQVKGTDHSICKGELCAAFQNRLKMLLKSHLDSGKLVRAVNAFAVPVLNYSFGIIKWSATDLKNLEMKMRVLFTKYRKHHPKSSVERFMLPRKAGGRGLVSLETLHERQRRLLQSYFRSGTERSALLAAISVADNRYTPLDLANRARQEETSLDHVANSIEKWKQKPLHGRYPNEIYSDMFDVEASHTWLTDGYLYPETEGFLVAIQDQVIPTKNYRKYIIGDGSLLDDTCRKCQQSSESIQHLTGGCPMLAPMDYKNRHDSVAKIVHAELAKMLGLCNDVVPYYKYKPASVLENENSRLYWDRTIITNREVRHNRPDITLLKKKEKTAWLIDISVPNSSNVAEAYNEKLRKYELLATEIKELWDLQSTKIVPLVVSSTGGIPKNLFTSLAQIELPRELYKKMQKAVVLHTCSLIRRIIG